MQSENLCLFLHYLCGVYSIMMSVSDCSNLIGLEPLAIFVWQAKGTYRIAGNFRRCKFLRKCL